MKRFCERDSKCKCLSKNTQTNNIVENILFVTFSNSNKVIYLLIVIVIFKHYVSVIDSVKLNRPAIYMTKGGPICFENF